jgi:hypothetical protein
MAQIAQRHPRRRLAAVAAALLLLTAGAGATSAAHTFGALDCGAAGSFEVDGRGPLPAGFDAPGPWSGLFLLHGTTRVFRAVSIVGAPFPFDRPAGAGAGSLVSCILTSSGPQFPAPWTLEGVLAP